MKYIFLLLFLVLTLRPAFCEETDLEYIEEDDPILNYKIEETEAYQTLMGDYEWDLNHLKISGDMYDNPNLNLYLDKMDSNEPFLVEETFVR